jgi:hypothetical protein
LGAATLPLLIGSAGFAVDSIQVALWKRQLQRAADSAAIAGAYALSQEVAEDTAVQNDLDEHIESDLENNERPVLKELWVNTGSYADGSMSTESCGDRAAALCFGRAVEVRLTAERTLPFMSIFTGSATEIRAEAVGALITDGEFCMISLYDGTEPGIDNNGNADVILKCGMASNSRATSAITSGGSSTIVASPIIAVGGLDGQGQNFEGKSVLQPYSAPQKDPLAYVANPDTSAMDCSQALSVGTQGSTPQSPGCYSSIEIKGKVTLNPGTYYIHGGDLSFGAQADVTGTGVTIVLTGANGQAGNIDMNGQAKLNLVSPGSGPFKGILFYRDRRAPTVTVKINGGSGGSLTGAIYMPTSDLWVGGNAAMDVACLQVVARKLTFRGTATVENKCSQDSGASSFEKAVVRLVG